MHLKINQSGKNRKKMFRLARTPRSTLRKNIIPSMKMSEDAIKTEVKPGIESAVREVLKLAPINRYIPTDSSAFLVERHRLTGTENIVQGLSSVLPWVILLVLGVSPLVFMQYNISKMSSLPKLPENAKPALISGEFKHILFSDMPEILERRSPTLVIIYSDNFQSKVLLPLFRDLSKKFNICIMPSSSASREFLKKYPTELCPFGHLILPDSKLVEYKGPWNAASFFQFLSLKEDSILDEKLPKFQKCVFKRIFADKAVSWGLDDTLKYDSLDDALTGCLAS